MIGRLFIILVMVASPATASRHVAITFDDLIDLDATEHSTAQIERLNRKLIAPFMRGHRPAVGFVNGDKLLDDAGGVDPQRVALLQLWLDAGLELGNHTWAHVDLDAVSIDEYEDDIVRGETVIRQLVTQRGGSLRWFRHPYLNTGTTATRRDAVASFLASHGYRVAPVTIDDSDWIFDLAYDRAVAGRHWLDAFRLRRAYVRYIRARFDWAEYESRLVFRREIPQILLLHASQLNADCVGSLLTMIHGRGYSIAALDTVLADQAYQSPDDWVGGGVGWIERWGVTAGIAAPAFESDPAVPRWVQLYAGAQDE